MLLRRYIFLILITIVTAFIALPKQASFAQELAGLPPANGITTPKEMISMGDFQGSIMYPPKKIDTLRTILDAYERTGIEVPLEEEVLEEDDDLLADLLEAPTVEEQEIEAPLPNIYVGTVIYRGAGNWSIWVNRKRINSSKPERDLGTHGSVQIMSVSSNLVTIIWKPYDMRRAASLWREREELHNNAMRHRRAQQVQVDFDPDKKQFVMTLRPNQTFVGESMEIIEGRILGPEPADIGGIISVTDENGVTRRSGANSDQRVDPDSTRRDALFEGTNDMFESEKDSTRRLMDKLVEENKKLDRVVPVNRRNAPQWTDPQGNRTQPVPQGRTTDNINDHVDDGDLP
ncbi:MAG: hypothetical protein MRY32_05475 [Rickettsiales bacterium]|nr:hypothetical protein [Rickettsiales bacterium]